MNLNFERTTDYPAVRALLTEPRCWRRMTGDVGPRSFEVGPRPDTEYVVAKRDAAVLAAFVILDGMEVHFCFHPDAWGHTLPIAKAFLAWWWENTREKVLVGPIPRHNRLALALAKKAGFREYREGPEGALIYTFLQRPEAA